MPRPSIALVSEAPFWRRDTGLAQRVAAMQAALLHAGYATPVFYVRGLTKQDKAILKNAPAEAPVVVPLFTERLQRQARLRLHRQGEPERCRAFVRFLERVAPDRVIFIYADTGYLLEGLPTALRKKHRMILDTIDVMALRTERYRAAGYEPLRPMSAEEEQRLLCRFDALIAIQAQEAAWLRQRLPETPVWMAGHPAPPKPFRFREASPRRLLFLGAQGEHNRIALRDFLDTVWPALHERLGDRLCLHVVGRVSESFDPGAYDSGVRFTVFAPDLDKVYAEADIVVNPIFVGSGLKIKNVEALAWGKPLVTTPVGAEGFEAGIGEALWVCADAAEMIAAITLLAEDTGERRRLADAAHRYAREVLNEAAVFQDLFAGLRA